MYSMSELIETDRRLVAALLAHPRASLGRIGEAIGVSEATVSRRAARLFERRLVRVVGVLDKERSQRGREVLVRLRCRPGAGRRVAGALVGWEETGLVSVLGGSADCMAGLTVTSNEHLLRLIMEELPRLDGVVATSTAMVIRRFATPHGWCPPILPQAAVERLRRFRRDDWRERTEPPVGVAGGLGEAKARLSTVDEALIAELGRDGRLRWQELAQACGTMPSTARRRVESLLARGLLRLRTVVDPALLGYPVTAYLWLRVNATHLSAAGRLLANHPAVVNIAATTGEQNLCGEVAVADDDALYDFLTGTVGRIAGLQDTDVTMELRTLKRAMIPAAGTIGESSG
jgi:DNA-binding Lrp family transcriptional regulator